MSGALPDLEGTPEYHFYLGDPNAATSPYFTQVFATYVTAAVAVGDQVVYLTDPTQVNTGCYILIDSEYMQVTFASSSNPISVTRSQYPAPTTHAVGTSVYITNNPIRLNNNNSTLEINNGLNSGQVNIKVGRLDGASLRATSGLVATSGAGLELLYTGGQGVVQTVTRPSGAFGQTGIEGNPLNLNVSSNSAINAGTGAFTFGGGPVSAAGTIRSTNTTPPVSGVGAELVYNGTDAVMQGFDRGGSALIATRIEGNPLRFNTNANGAISTGTGAFTVAGNLAHTGSNAGFFNHAVSAQQSAVGAAAGYTAGTTAATFHSDDKYSGNTGATSYTINGIVAALKAYGLLAA